MGMLELVCIAFRVRERSSDDVEESFGRPSSVWFSGNGFGVTDEEAMLIVQLCSHENQMFEQIACSQSPRQWLRVVYLDVGLWLAGSAFLPIMTPPFEVLDVRMSKPRSMHQFCVHPTLQR
jgi:hypothetical protein